MGARRRSGTHGTAQRRKNSRYSGIRIGLEGEGAIKYLFTNDFENTVGGRAAEARASDKGYYVPALKECQIEDIQNQQRPSVAKRHV